MAKIIHEDGSVTYYYYKKKIGRKKKRGPQKKKKLRGRRWQDTWDYKIIKFDFRKQDKYIGKYHDLEEVEKKKNELLKINNNVLFPKKYVNNGRVSEKIYDYESEYVILKRTKEDVEAPKVTKVRNEYGMLINSVTTSKNWEIYDKFPCLVEETFWVYGYNPKIDRKTLHWVLENFIDEQINNTYDFVRIILYNNKVLFRYEFNSFEFLICKNVSDAIRMYNIIENKYKKNIQVVMCGMASKKNEKTNEIVNMIKDKTGWDYNKIYKKSTRS